MPIFSDLHTYQRSYARLRRPLPPPLLAAAASSRGVFPIGLCLFSYAGGENAEVKLLPFSFAPRPNGKTYRWTNSGSDSATTHNSCLSLNTIVTYFYRIQYLFYYLYIFLTIANLTTHVRYTCFSSSTYLQWLHIDHTQLFAFFAVFPRLQ